MFCSQAEVLDDHDKFPRAEGRKLMIKLSCISLFGPRAFPLLLTLGVHSLHFVKIKNEVKLALSFTQSFKVLALAFKFLSILIYFWYMA